MNTDWRTRPSRSPASLPAAGSVCTRTSNRTPSPLHPPLPACADRKARNRRATSSRSATGARAGWPARLSPHWTSWPFLAPQVVAAAPATVLGGRGWRLMTPLSASNSGSLCTNVAFSRCAVAATHESANDNLWRTLSSAAETHNASSEWCHWRGNFRMAALIRAAFSAPRSYVRTYLTSVRLTKEAWSASSPRRAALRRYCTRSKPGSLSASVMNAEVSRRNESATSALPPAKFESSFIVFPVAPPIRQKSLQRVASSGASGYFVECRFELLIRNPRRWGRQLPRLCRHPVHLLAQFAQFRRRQPLNLFQYRLGFRAHALNLTRAA
jgi:hypothetical protein